MLWQVPARDYVPSLRQAVYKLFLIIIVPSCESFFLQPMLPLENITGENLQRTEFPFDTIQ